MKKMISQALNFDKIQLFFDKVKIFLTIIFSSSGIILTSFTDIPQFKFSQLVKNAILKVIERVISQGKENVLIVFYAGPNSRKYIGARLSID